MLSIPDNAPIVCHDTPMQDFAPTAREPRGKGPRTKKKMRALQAAQTQGQRAERRTRSERRGGHLHVDEQGRPDRR